MQEAEAIARMESQSMARQAVGVLDSGHAALGSVRRTYAQDLEDQIRAKKVGSFNPFRVSTMTRSLCM